MSIQELSDQFATRLCTNGRDVFQMEEIQLKTIPDLVGQDLSMWVCGFSAGYNRGGQPSEH